MRRVKPERSITLPPLPPLDAEDEIVPEAPRAPVIAVEPEAVRVTEAMLSQSRQAMRALDLRPLAMWERTAEIAAMLGSGDRRIRELTAGSVYPFAAYDRFRRDNAVRPPPGATPSAGGLTVVVDAAVAAPFLVRETLRSLQEQTVGDWCALVVAPPATRSHPVASFGDIDARIRFVAVESFAAPSGPCVLVSAGTGLDQHALAWLVFAAERTGAAAVIADHDHGVLDPDLGSLRADPWFFSAFDRVSLDWLPAPAAVWARALPVGETTPVFDGSDAWRRALLSAIDGPVAHVPRLLATTLELPINARNARETAQDPVAGRLGPVAPLIRVPEIAPCDDRIAVVIPTRDGADLLERAVASLRRTARAPERLDIVVVDNRSVEEDTRELFRRLEAEGAARRHPFDKPFNWGLVNNEGAAASDAPFLVFANNDIEMLSRGWDDVLVDALSDPGVGAVGARLLYPNGTVQHAGVVFGMVPGHTEHEGREVAATDPGPNRRLVTPRTVGAVTGAFLGMRPPALGGAGRDRRGDGGRAQRSRPVPAAPRAGADDPVRAPDRGDPLRIGHPRLQLDEGGRRLGRERADRSGRTLGPRLDDRGHRRQPLLGEIGQPVRHDPRTLDGRGGPPHRPHRPPAAVATQPRRGRARRHVVGRTARVTSRRSNGAVVR